VSIRLAFNATRQAAGPPTHGSHALRGHPARIYVRSSRAPSSEPWKRPRNLENRAETIGSERDFPVTRATPRRIRIEGRKTFVPIGSNGHKSLDFARHHWHKMNIQYISFDIAFRGLGVATAPGYGKPWIAFARQKFPRSGFDEHSNHLQ
jgi:hypothetical protein